MELEPAPRGRHLRRLRGRLFRRSLGLGRVRRCFRLSCGTFEANGAPWVLRKLSPRYAISSLPRCGAKVFDLIKKCKARNWTFAYLGANQEAYEESGRIGYSAASTQLYRSDSAGTGSAFHSIRDSMSRRRRKILERQAYESSDFFEGDKPAEEDERKRSKKPH